MRRRLAWQVVGAGILASAFGGAVAAWVSATTAREMVQRNEDAQLLLVAEDFAEEIVEEMDEPLFDDSEEERRHFQTVHGERTLTNIIIHELEGLRYPEPQATVHLNGVFPQGSVGLPQSQVGTCVREPERHRRVCTVDLLDRGTLTLAIGTKRSSSRDELFQIGIVVGALVGGLLGGVASLILGRWTLRPLGDLRRRVKKVKTHDPSHEVLEVPAPYPEELEELRQAISELVARLGEALFQAQSFATHSAHELRTPLTTLSGELELLIEDADDPADLLRMKEQLDRLTALIHRLLVLASSVDSMQTTGQAVDCGDLVEAVVSALPEDKRKRLTINLLDEDLLVRGDENLLFVLLSNGVENALKFSDDQVKITAKKFDGQLYLEIEDSGPGIAFAEREQVFSPFFRTQTARKSGVSGHGIGLALIAHVARIHGGQATFVDRKVGSQLRVQIPLWAGSVAG